MIEYNNFKKYNIMVSEDGITYVKYMPVGNTDSKNLIKHRLHIKDLFPSSEFEVEDGDTLTISPFGRDRTNPDIYGFFVINVNKQTDITMGIHVDEEKYPTESIELYKYVGQTITRALKNEGLKDVKVLASMIMNKKECNRYIYYYELLGDENKAFDYVYNEDIKTVMLYEHQLEKYDILLRFRPEDLDVILDNLHEISENFKTGSYSCINTNIKGFVYLNKEVECDLIRRNETFNENNSSSRVCPSNGLYLCLHSEALDVIYSYDFTQAINACYEDFGIRFIASTGININIEEDSGVFIKSEEELNSVLREIKEDKEKYKANYDIECNSIYEESFKSKGLDNLVFSDVIIKSSPEGMREIYEKIDDIRNLLSDTNLFVKGFIYANESAYTTSDCDFDLESDYPNTFEYNMTKNTVYLVLGDKESYMTSYDAIDELDDFLDNHIKFTVMVNACVGDEAFNGPEKVKYLNDTELERTMLELKSVKNIEKYICNHIISWENSYMHYLFEFVKTSAKRVSKDRYLLASLNTIYDDDITRGIAKCEIYFKEIDLSKISDEDIKVLKDYYREMMDLDEDDDMKIIINGKCIISNKKHNDSFNANLIAYMFNVIDSEIACLEEYKNAHDTTNPEYTVEELDEIEYTIEELEELQELQEAEESLEELKKLKNIIDNCSITGIRKIELLKEDVENVEKQLSPGFFTLQRYIANAEAKL